MPTEAPYIDLDLTRAVLAEYQTRILGKQSMTLGDEIMVMCVLAVLKSRGQVIVDRARFERLRETAAAAHDARYGIVLTPRMAKAIFAHQHGDLDPIP